MASSSTMLMLASTRTDVKEKERSTRESSRCRIVGGSGEVAEWPKAPHSKCGIPQGIVGSNPTLSAKLSYLSASVF